MAYKGYLPPEEEEAIKNAILVDLRLGGPFDEMKRSLEPRLRKMPMGALERDRDLIHGPITITAEYREAFAKAKQKEMDDWNKMLREIKMSEIKMHEKKMFEMIGEKERLEYLLTKIKPFKEKNVIKRASIRHQISILNDQIEYIKKVSGLTYEEPLEEKKEIVKVSLWQKIKTCVTKFCSKVKKKVTKVIRRNSLVIDALAKLAITTVTVISHVKLAQQA
jgi:hypothetical protein